MVGTVGVRGCFVPLVRLYGDVDAAWRRFLCITANRMTLGANNKQTILKYILKFTQLQLE